MKNQKLKLFSFMATDGWVIFINLVRILSLIGVVVLIYIMVKNIEAVKLIGKEPCEICLNRCAGIVCQ